MELTPFNTVLTERAADYLTSLGTPCDARELIAHVCQLPNAPATVAEHLARTIFAGHGRFVREPDGRWRLTTPTDLPDESLESLSYAVVDVETTGTSPAHGDRITEIAIVHVNGGVVTPVFESLVNPERTIPPRIVALTNISWEMVKDAPTFADVAPQIVESLGSRVFVAHNAAFDWRFVSHEIRRATGKQLAGRSLCTVKLARKVLPQLRRRSLDWVTNYYNVDIAARHRALGDAEATAHVLVRLLRDARVRGCATWNDLGPFLAAGGAARRPRRAPAMPHPVRLDTTA